MKKNRAIFLCGPTASGKTALGLELAEHLPIEIISVDSALIYQHLDIGSAKPSKDELQQVPHHLIDIITPLQTYSVMEFLKDCNQKISEINARGKIPLLLGGTMMYYNALIKGISVLPEADMSLRHQLDLDFAKFGNLHMHQRLVTLDPISAAKISPQDKQRIQRALEVCILTGKSMSDAQKDSHLDGLVACDYLPLAIVPENRALLHERINQRFAKMLAAGFIDEVKFLRELYPELTANHNSMRCVGYRQVWDYLDNRLTYDEMLSAGQSATRQLAKRQITWLRSMEVIPLDDEGLRQEKLKEKIIKLVDEFC